MKNNFICKCKKTVSGVTLIALIVTVIVALILAGVGIVTLTSKDEVIEKSKLAKEKIEGYTEKEGDMVKDTLKYPNSSDCKHKNTEKRNATGTFSGDTYCLDCGVLLATGTIQPCETHPTTTITEAVAATCCSKGNTGNTVCTVCGYIVTPGTEIAINPSNHVGGTEIRNKTDSYTGDTYCLGCGVIIEKGIYTSAGLEIGSYVEYNIDYTDIYVVGKEYTSENGWRYLGTDDNGNKLIISTGIPVLMSYRYRTNAGVDKNGWWGTDSQVASEFGSTYATGYSNYPNRYAAYGLRYNIEKMKYTQADSGEAVFTTGTAVDGVYGNKAMGTLAGNGANGTMGTIFRATNIPAGKILNVRTLTQKEYENAVINSGSNQGKYNPAKLTGAGFGLFYVYELDSNYLNEQEYGYWLADPYTGETTSVHSPASSLLLFDDDGIWKTQTNRTVLDDKGIRPVIVLSADVELVDTDGDGRFEIVY